MIDKLGASNQVIKSVTPPLQQRETEVAKEVEEVQKQPSKAEMERIIQGMNEFLKPSTLHVKFEFHDELEEYYVTMVDDVTQEVIREIPSKKVLDMYAAMTEHIGILVDKKI
ncbi:flagellar protein FlaG [Bacillus sp. REN10]|uniref:flagellar protein FlaG n=1 Tax=Bacillus sp. REN10 TaxID=2782541 RepID=UPI00193B659F|nr:flagellar protein FlaG [Bacillus sp. REN10]